MIACALLIPVFASQSQAAILDGGFESAAPNGYTGDLGNGWMAAQGTILILRSGTYPAVAHSGDQFADLDNAFTFNSLSQTVATIPGQTYTLSYWIADTSPDPLTVAFDGVVLFSGNAPTAGVTSPSDYIQYVFTVAPTSSNAVLTFTGHYTGLGNSLGTNPMRWDCARQGCFNIKKRPKIELLADCLPGRIAFGDVDAIVEVCGNFLLLEWKDHPQLGMGQRLLFERLTLLCPATALIVEGDAEAMTVSSIRPVRGGVLWPTEPTDLEGLRQHIRAWTEQALTNPALRAHREAS